MSALGFVLGVLAMLGGLAIFTAWWRRRCGLADANRKNVEDDWQEAARHALFRD
ncbi:hypothetical protein ACWDKQ_02190 [Saccharopolyspora sp. NPDC000995]